MAPAYAEALRVHAAQVLGMASHDVRLLPTQHGRQVVGASRKYLVQSQSGRRLAFVHQSPPESADLAQRGAEGAKRARAALGPDLGRAVLTPLGTGEIDGASYAVWPAMAPLSHLSLVHSAQVRLLRTPLLVWLRQATEHTKARVPAEQVANFREPLARLIQLAGFPEPLKNRARTGLDRLDRGYLVPAHVLMHSDLWVGNVLLDPRVRSWRLDDRFVIIDWPGCLTRGYAMFDLVRLMLSCRCSPRRARAEIEQHCRILECDTVDASTHLMVALGRVAMTLEHFPFERFVSMSRSCTGLLDRVGL